MTAVLERADSAGSDWSSMPGWGLVADLTPPELITARALTRLRRLMTLGLIALLIVCAGGYVYASLQSSRAEDDLSNAQAGTAALQARAAKYGGVTQIQAAVAGVQGQLANAMAADVDQAALIASIRGALPADMSIKSLSITFTPTSSPSAAVASPAPTPGNTPTSSAATGTASSTTPTVIGSLAISGTGRTLDDLPAFVDRLSKVSGIASVLPGTNSVTKGVSQFSLSASLTDQLFSHRYAVKVGG